MIHALLGAAAAAGVVAAVLWRHMRRIEPERVEIVHREIPLAGLPQELDGLRIAHISDLHITRDPRNRDVVAEAIGAVEADLYALTGDLIHGPSGPAALVEWLAGLDKAMVPGFAVLGNAEHKLRVRTAAVCRALHDHGIRVLRNESASIRLRDTDLQIVGLDDPHTGLMRVADAYARADPDCWTLVLVHSPEGVLALDGRRADLVLAGHTHGGQIVLPGIGWLADNTHSRLGLISGLYTAHDLAERAGLAAPPGALYVSRGLGTSGWPLRLRCRPELPVLTLRRTASQEHWTSL